MFMWTASSTCCTKNHVCMFRYRAFSFFCLLKTWTTWGWGSINYVNMANFFVLLCWWLTCTISCNRWHFLPQLNYTNRKWRCSLQYEWAAAMWHHGVITKLDFMPVNSPLDSTSEQSENVTIAFFLVTAAVDMQWGVWRMQSWLHSKFVPLPSAHALCASVAQARQDTTCEHALLIGGHAY